MRDVHDWLRNLGMDQYSRIFSEHEIDGETLLELKDGDLRELGIALGHRKRILREIRQLAENAGRSKDDDRARSERRLLTILFVDIVESTSFAQRLDPEDLASLLNAFHETSSRVVERFGGYVARNLGDGLAAYFGWPESDEHDAERAVLTAFELIEVVKEIPTKTADRIQLHIAAATGEAVIGDVLRMDSERVHEVFGPLPNLAARLQAISPPDSILISEETHRLIHHKFVCVDVGRKKLRGFQGLTPISQVIRPRALSLNFDARRAIGLTPLIGRDAELDVLNNCWKRAVAGHGQIVMLAGEPGIGKSRLCAELISSLDEKEYLRLSLQCSSLHRNSPLYPVVRCLGQFAGLSDDDPAEAKWQKLKALLHTVDDDRLSGISLLAAYLGITPVANDLKLASPDRQRLALHQLLANFILMLAHRQPVLIVFEDAHWADPTTAELLDILISQVPNGAILLIATFRPTFSPRWRESELRTLLNVNRLTPDQSAQLIHASTTATALPRDVIEEIIQRSDGNPLFIEELTAAAVLGRSQFSKTGAAGAGRILARSSIPSTLQESLLARIDRTSARARELLQLCAVVGRRFSHEQISVIADTSRRELDDALNELVNHGLLHLSGQPPNSEYSFKHVLVQDAAYTLILREKRQRLHAACAAALEKHFPAIRTSDPGSLGLHHEIAGNTQAAIIYFLAAGQLAIDRFALDEASTSIRRGLSLLEALPESEWRNEHELRYRSLLGRVCIFARGWADPSVKTEYTRALELSEALGLEKQQVPLEWALATYHLLRGEIREALIGGHRVLELAEHEKNNDLLHVAHSALTIYQFYGGNFLAAVDHADQALQSYRAEASEELRKQFGTDRRLQALRGAALSHWCLGNHQNALDLDEEQRSAAMSGGHTYEHAYALTISCILHALRRDGPRTYSAAEDAIAIAQNHGYNFLEANARNFRAMAQALRDPRDVTLDECDHAIEAYQLAGNRMGISSMLAIMAELCGQVGLHERGLRYIDKGLIYVRRSGERFAQSDLYRVKGELLSAANRIEDAKYWLSRALLLAQKQHAKTWELLAAISLARVFLGQSESKRGLELLLPWYQARQKSSFVSDQLSRARGIYAQLESELADSLADRGADVTSPKVIAIRSGKRLPNRRD